VSLSRPEVWLIIVLAALITLAERGVFLLSRTSAPLPPVIKRALRFVPAAVFAAIAVPALAQPSGTALGPIDVRLLAGIIGAAVAWKTRNLTVTFLVGMAALWSLSWLLR